MVSSDTHANNLFLYTCDNAVNCQLFFENDFINRGDQGNNEINHAKDNGSINQENLNRKNFHEIFHSIKTAAR